GEAVREARSAAVHHDQPGGAREAREERRQGRVPPGVLEVREESGQQEDVARPVSDDLIGDRNAAGPGVVPIRAHRSPPASAWSSRSRNGACAPLIFFRAASRSNHATRSISGKVCVRPDRGGHSISNVLLTASAGSRSPSAPQARTTLPDFWRISPSSTN